jgi:hypothetical protein
MIEQNRLFDRKCLGHEKQKVWAVVGCVWWWQGRLLTPAFSMFFFSSCFFSGSFVRRGNIGGDQTQ